jgi:hypothetical protein
MSAIAPLRQAFHYSRGLYDFWRAPLDTATLPDQLRAMVAGREAAFLDMLASRVYGHPGSPYLALLQAAGIGHQDVVALVSDVGLESALGRLYEAGVYVTLEEFKGNTPTLRRGSVEIPISAAAFDNPLNAGHAVGATGGTRSSGTRLAIDVADQLDELAGRYVNLQTRELATRPFAMWRTAPPSLAMIRMSLAALKLGARCVRWFSPTRPGLGPTSGKSALQTWNTIVVSGAMGHRIPFPEYVPMEQAETVARWLAKQTAQGRRLTFYVTVSLGARLCLAARSVGLDISGHALRLSSEPITDGKAELFRSAGLDWVAGYGMNDAGSLGISCGNPAHTDEMHLLINRSAFLLRPRVFDGLDTPVSALYLSAFTTRTPKVLINVESGDYATPIERTCGCLAEEAGLTQRVHTIRSYEKLTSAGMHFMGSALVDVLEGALPARFGGGPTDYQFVETEEGGETRVKLVIHPDLGPLDHARVVDFVLDELRRRTRAGRMQTEVWRSGGTLQVERARPYLTSTAKIQPLHVERPH